MPISAPFAKIPGMRTIHIPRGAFCRRALATAAFAAFLLPAAAGIDEAFLETLLKMPSETHDVAECNKALDFVKTYLETCWRVSKMRFLGRAK